MMKKWGSFIVINGLLFTLTYVWLYQDVRIAGWLIQGFIYFMGTCAIVTLVWASDHLTYRRWDGPIASTLLSIVVDTIILLLLVLNSELLVAGVFFVMMSIAIIYEPARKKRP